MSNDAHSTSTTSTTAHEIAHNWLEKFSAAFDVAAVTTLRKHWAAYFWMTAIGGISPLFLEPHHRRGIACSSRHDIRDLARVSSFQLQPHEQRR